MVVRKEEYLIFLLFFWFEYTTFEIEPSRILQLMINECKNNEKCVIYEMRGKLHQSQTG